MQCASAMLRFRRRATISRSAPSAAASCSARPSPDDGNGRSPRLSAADVTIGDVGHNFTVAGDACSSAFAEISATCGDVSIGNIVGDFLNQGLIDADYGTLSIGTVGGSFVNDGVMRAYELQIAANGSALDNHGKIIVSGSGLCDSTIGVDVHNDGFIKATDGAVFNFDGTVNNFDCGTIKATYDGYIDFAHWVGGNGTLAMDGGTIESGQRHLQHHRLFRHLRRQSGARLRHCGGRSDHQLRPRRQHRSLRISATFRSSATRPIRATRACWSCIPAAWATSICRSRATAPITRSIISCCRSTAIAARCITEGPAIDVLNQVVNNDSESTSRP